MKVKEHLLNYEKDIRNCCGNQVLKDSSGAYFSGRYVDVFISKGMTLQSTLWFPLEKHVSVCM